RGRREKDIQDDVAEVAVEPARFHPHVARRHVTESDPRAFRLPAGDFYLDGLVVAIHQLQPYRIADFPGKLREDDARRHQLAQGRALVSFVGVLEQRSERGAVDFDELPPGTDPPPAGIRALFDCRHQGLAVHHAEIDAGGAFVRVGAALLIEVLVELGGNDVEMRLPEPAQHASEDGAHLDRAIGLLHLRPQLFTDLLPVDTSHLWIPMLVADRGPNLI